MPPRPPAADGSRFRFDVVGLGEISVDDVLCVEGAPRWGEKAAVVRRERLGGGQVATAMVALARLGLRAALVGAVGDDEAGRFALDGLRAEGVDTSGVRVGEGRTRTATIVVDAEGNRTVLSDRDPRLSLAARDVPSSLVTTGRVLHVDGSFPEAAVAAARAAREAGSLVSCDLDERAATDGALLPLVDVCIVSPHYLAASEPRADAASATARSAGERDLAGLVALHRAIAPGGLACVTLGSGGAALFDGREWHRERAFPMQGVLDTTACGDTFRAGFLAALLDGRDLAGCMRFASAAAALKTRDVGRRGCPTRTEVDAFLAVER